MEGLGAGELSSREIRPEMPLSPPAMLTPTYNGRAMLRLLASLNTVVTAQTDDSDNTDNLEPPATPHPTKVGADQEKYPHLRGRLGDWALAAETEEEASKSDDGTRDSSQPVGPSQEELRDNGGVIGARVMVNARVADAGSTVKAWLTNNNITHDDQGATISLVLRPDQLAQLGPLSALEAVYSVEEPGMVFGGFPSENLQPEPDRGPPAPTPPAKTNSSP